MAKLATVLRNEIQRLAKKEARAETTLLKKQSAQYRHDVAELKRTVQQLRRQVAFLEKREKRRLEKVPAADGPPAGSRFSVRSLKAQRRKTGLSQADYGSLLGVSTLTMNNWENGKTKPGPKHLARIVAIRGIGKREAQRRLELIE